MLVDLKLDKEKENGATWDSPSQKDFSYEWQRAINNKHRAAKVVGLPSTGNEKIEFEQPYLREIRAGLPFETKM